LAGRSLQASRARIGKKAVLGETVTRPLTTNADCPEASKLLISKKTENDQKKCAKKNQTRTNKEEEKKKSGQALKKKKQWTVHNLK